MSAGRSLVRRPRTDPPEWRLLCLPHAGAGAAALSSWFAGAPADCEVVVIRLPGRESRLGEAPLGSVVEAAQAVFDDVRDLLDLPFVVFGYSMGALVAYELTRLLADGGGPLPALLAVGGHEAPQAGRRHAPIHDLPDDQFMAALRTLGGTPDEVLQMPELFAMLAPTLRADLRIVETYQHRHDLPLPVPVITYVGTDDAELEDDAVAAWSQITDRGYAHRTFPGAHFFFTEPGSPLLASVVADARRQIAAAQA